MKLSRLTRSLAVIGHRRPVLAALGAYAAVSAFIWLLAGLGILLARLAT